MKNLYIDFDGVIMDTITKTYDIMRNLDIDLDNEDEVHKFYEELDWKKLLLEADEINGAIGKVIKLYNCGKYNVAILTHVNSLNEAVEKVKFVRKFYGDVTIIPVPKVISKTQMVHTKDAVLVDDYTGNLIEWKAEGGIGIKFSPDLKKRDFPVINDLDALLDLDKLIGWN